MTSVIFKQFVIYIVINNVLFPTKINKPLNTFYSKLYVIIIRTFYYIIIFDQLTDRKKSIKSSRILAESRKCRLMAFKMSL